ncbi:MAG: CPBP family intramembrane metalloprotease, partial [Candidatus Electryoneaceae bacterium]|nr:CPBP family intramembrane metalloprotease [Candidatus Electryoneaceae bacterium]
MSDQRNNLKFILIFGVIAVLMLIYGIINFHRAFTQVAVDFKVTKAEALQIAREYVESRNFDISDYQESIIFTYSAGAKIFLEKELGVERMVELTRDTVDVWHWSARFFKPLQKLEYTVFMSPAGEVVEFMRRIEEDAAGLSMEPDAARILAEMFLVNKMDIDLDQWEFIENSIQDRINRRDHTFTYELIGFKAADAPYRIAVEVQGAEIGSFRRFLKVPQKWWREWSKQRSQNELYQNIATFLMFLTVIGVLFYFFRNIRYKQIPWKTALWLGGALAIAFFIMGINSLPLNLAGYNTTQSYGFFLGQLILMSLVGGLTSGLMLVLLFGAGEPLYRQDNPDKLYIPSLFTRRGYQTKEFFQATIVGYLLAAFHIGFVVMFYVIGEKLGFWAPSQVDYTNAVSTWLPWIFPLAISMSAAMTEEFWFRLFAIPFFKRILTSIVGLWLQLITIPFFKQIFKPIEGFRLWLLKIPFFKGIFNSTVLALIIPAFIWGFLHSNYPQQPGFVRGIEVGLIGILAGVVMLRFGIWATLTWHFVIDAIFIGLFLFQSDNAYYWTSGLIVCGGLAIPAIVAGVYYLRKRKFEVADDILNRAMESPSGEKIEPHIGEDGHSCPSEPSIEQVTEKPFYQPLSSNIKRIALFIGIVGIFLALLPGPKKFGEDFSVTIHRNDAIETAKDVLRERYGVDPDTFLISATCPKQMADSYVKRYGSMEDAEQIYLTPEGDQFFSWFVRFKRELNPEMFNVHIMRDGSVYTY